MTTPRKREEAVREIASVANTLVVKSACERAIKEGTDSAMISALVTSREASQQAWVSRVANDALGTGK